MSNQIPVDWVEETLGTFISGSMAGEWGNEAVGDKNDIPILRATNFSESGAIDYTKLAFRNIDEKKIQQKLLQRGEIVLEKSGGSPAQPVGRVIYFNSTKPFLYSNFTQKLIPSEKCDSKYLFYKFYFEYQNKTVLKFQQQTTGIINFQLKEYLLYKTTFPPLYEQQKIAKILTSVDEVIEKTQAQIDKLKDLKTGMMQELLTTGIGHTEFKDSPVGRIPAEWKLVSLGELGVWKGGGTPSKANKEFWSGNIPWVSPKDMKTDFISKTKDAINEDAIKCSSTNLIKSGSILIVVRSGILQHTLPLAIASNDLTINQDMKALSLSEKYYRMYIYHYIKGNNHKVLRACLKAGNTVESIDFSRFSEYKIPCPPLIEQKRIGDAVESIAINIRKKEQVLKTYKKTKKALMQDLLTGKVRVKVDGK